MNEAKTKKILSTIRMIHLSVAFAVSRSGEIKIRKFILGEIFSPHSAIVLLHYRLKLRGNFLRCVLIIPRMRFSNFIQFFQSFRSLCTFDERLYHISVNCGNEKRANYGGILISFIVGRISFHMKIPLRAT